MYPKNPERYTIVAYLVPTGVRRSCLLTYTRSRPGPGHGRVPTVSPLRGHLQPTHNPHGPYGDTGVRLSGGGCHLLPHADFPPHGFTPPPRPLRGPCPKETPSFSKEEPQTTRTYEKPSEPRRECPTSGPVECPSVTEGAGGRTTKPSTPPLHRDRPRALRSMSRGAPPSARRRVVVGLTEASRGAPPSTRPRVVVGLTDVSNADTPSPTSPREPSLTFHPDPRSTALPSTTLFSGVFRVPERDTNPTRLSDEVPSPRSPVQSHHTGRH